MPVMSSMMKSLLVMNVVLAVACLYLLIHAHQTKEWSHNHASGVESVSVQMALLQKELGDLKSEFEKRANTNTLNQTATEAFQQNEVASVASTVNSDANAEEIKAKAEQAKQYKQEAERYRSAMNKTKGVSSPSAKDTQPVSEQKLANDTMPSQ